MKAFLFHLQCTALIHEQWNAMQMQHIWKQIKLKQKDLVLLKDGEHVQKPNKWTFLLWQEQPRQDDF